MRVWFDRQLSGQNGTIDVLETPDFAPVNLIAQYHLLEEESAAWANKTGGACVGVCVFVGGGVDAHGWQHALFPVHALDNDHGASSLTHPIDQSLTASVAELPNQPRTTLHPIARLNHAWTNGAHRIAHPPP